MLLKILFCEIIIKNTKKIEFFIIYNLYDEST